MENGIIEREQKIDISIVEELTLEHARMVFNYIEKLKGGELQNEKTNNIHQKRN